MKFEKQDLVHPPDRLEAVQVVLGGLALDMAGLVREVGARRMDPLAPLLQHCRDGALREPVDLQLGVELAQLVGDGSVALGVTEADRRGDVERALATRLAPHPAARGGGGATKSRSSRFTFTGSRACGKWPRPFERDELAARRLGERHAAGVRPDRVLVAVDHEHRAADAAQSSRTRSSSESRCQRRSRSASRASVSSPQPMRPRSASSSAAP